LGDIEDVNGHTCVVCPWHYYVVALDNGEKYGALVLLAC
jgi:Bardet-Biedl syndrome 9 protein